MGNCTMLKRLKTLGDLAGPEMVLILVSLYWSVLWLLETMAARERRQTAGLTSPGLLMVI